MTHDPALSLTFEDYISPQQAAERIHAISLQLEEHNLDHDCAEELALSLGSTEVALGV